MRGGAAAVDTACDECTFNRKEIDMTDISSDPVLTHAPSAAYGAPSRGGKAIVGDAARAVFGQVMGWWR
jgi:hypothetical protein